MRVLAITVFEPLIVCEAATSLTSTFARGVALAPYIIPDKTFAPPIKTTSCETFWFDICKYSVDPSCYLHRSVEKFLRSG